MELRDMRVVLAIAQYGSITRAAKALHQSTSAVSHSLLLLERELGVPLFQRLPRGMALTDAGEHFLPAARRTLHEAELARETTDNVRGLRAGHLTISAARAFTGPLSELVASFVHSYPAVLIRINTPQNSEAVLDSVRRGESDVGFTAATSFPNDVRAEPAYELPLGIAVPSEHEFAGRNSISIDDLDGVSLVGPPHTTPQRQHVDALFFGSGLTPSYVAEADTQEMMLELVRAGVGVTFCPLVSASDGHKHRGGIVVLELKPASVATVMVLLSRGQQPTAAAIAFFEMACQAHRPII